MFPPGVQILPQGGVTSARGWEPSALSPGSSPCPCPWETRTTVPGKEPFLGSLQPEGRRHGAGLGQCSAGQGASRSDSVASEPA